MAAPKSSFKIILGSSSMARRRILAEMGYEFKIMTADIDEKAIRMEKAEELVMALAEAKADAIITRIRDTTELERDIDPTLLITADTVVTYQGTIREKPSSKQEAEEFIKGYSGGHAGVVGSVLVTNLKTGTRKGGWEKAEVYFYDIPPEAIRDLVNHQLSSYFLFSLLFDEHTVNGEMSQIEEGSTLNVAGGLMLEHPLTLPFVETVVGSYDTVMGLSKSLTEKLMREALQLVIEVGDKTL